MSSSEIAYRPQPIKQLPHSNSAPHYHLLGAGDGPAPPKGLSTLAAAVREAVVEAAQAPRPSSANCNFQPKGAVLRAKVDSSLSLFLLAPQWGTAD